MSYIRILDEGNAVQDRCCEVNFVGAGVAATRPSLNDRVTVTIPSGADVGGWTRDLLTTTVRLTNAGDAVAIGAALPVGPERVFIAPIGGGPATRIAGESIWPKVATAAAAASQARSQIVRWTASMWTGAAEVERDFQVYAAPSSLAADEAGGSRAEWVIDYEGWRLLMVQPTAAAPGAVPGVIFRSSAPDGATPGIEFQMSGNFGVGNPAFRWSKTEGTGVLGELSGDGCLFLNGLPVVAGASLEYKKHAAYAGSQSRIWTEAYPSTTTAWETAVAIPLTDQRAYSIRATITGINVGRTRWASYELAVGAHREGAGAVLDAFSLTIISETDATWDVQAIQNANDILIQVRAHNFGGDPAEETYWLFDLMQHSPKSNA